MDLKSVFESASKTLHEWKFPGSFGSAWPLGKFDVISGIVQISTQVHKACNKCSGTMPIPICNACGKNSGNSVKINSGLGNGDFILWGIGDSKDMPHYPSFAFIPFDECLDPGNAQFGKNFWETRCVPVVVAKFDADSCYRKYPSVFVGDQGLGLEGERFFAGSRIPLGWTKDSLAEDADASMYVIAWIGYLHNPVEHFLINQSNQPGSTLESYSIDQSGELGVVACHIVPEEILAEFLPLYDAAKPQLSALTELATSPRQFALVDGAYVAGPNSSELLSKMTTKDSRTEVAEWNKETWGNIDPNSWYIGDSWKAQLDSLDLGDKFIDALFETAGGQEGGSGYIIARADSLRLRGQMAACQKIINRLEAEYASYLNDQNRQMIRAMNLTPAGHPLGSWSFN